MNTVGNADPRPGRRGWIVWLLAVTFVMYYFSFQTGYSISNSRVQQDLSLSVSQIAAIAAVYSWAFALCQFLSGALLDRLGAGRIIPASVLIVTIAVFLFANAQSFEMLLLSQVIFAVGACSGFVGAGYVGGQWFGMAKFSLMFGLVQFAASFFSAFNQNMLGLALNEWPWRTVFNWIGVFGLILFALVALYVRNPQPVPRPTESFGTFLSGVLRNILAVASIPHVLLASAFGACCFGVMLALGVVWAPKLLLQRGFDATSANVSASLLWLGLAAGCVVIPRWSDQIRRRKIPILAGIALQLVSLTGLFYLPNLNPVVLMLLCFVFGFGNAAHMLAFSTAADVVQPAQIGTSASIVNGLMFLAGGVMISRPGVRIGLGLEEGIDPTSQALVAQATAPLFLAILAALVVAVCLRETYPQKAQLTQLQ